MKGEKLRKFFSNPWTVSIGGTLFGFILTVLRDLVKGDQVLSTFKTIITWFWKVLIIVLTFEIKVWWMLIGIVLLILGLLFYSKILDSKEEKEIVIPFLNYTQDTILGYKWEWTWEKDYFGKYGAENVHPICDKCDTPLVSQYTGRLKCLRCNKTYQKELPDINNVKMMIHDNVKRIYFSGKEM